MRRAIAAWCRSPRTQEWGSFGVLAEGAGRQLDGPRPGGRSQCARAHRQDGQPGRSAGAEQAREGAVAESSGVLRSPDRPGRVLQVFGGVGGDVLAGTDDMLHALGLTPHTARRPRWRGRRWRRSRKSLGHLNCHRRRGEDLILQSKQPARDWSANHIR